MALKTELGTLLLQAYQEALKTRKATDFTVSGIASLIIRLEGRDGRVAVQETKRKTSPASASMNSPRQEASGKKSERLRFPKQEEEGRDEAAMKVTSRLKRIGQEEDKIQFNPDSPEYKSQKAKAENLEDVAVDTEEVLAERDYWKATAMALQEAAQAKAEADGTAEESTEQKIILEEDKGLDTSKGPVFVFQENKPPKDKPERTEKRKELETPKPTPEFSPLSEAEQELIKQMKPAGAGREFGLERLRATLTKIGIEYEVEQSATVLAGALIKHLNPK